MKQLQLYAIMYAMSFTPAVSYTSYNLTILLHAIATRDDFLYMMVATNTLCICLTFYSVQLLLDSSFFNRMQKRLGITRMAFISGDLCFHILPLVWLTYNGIKDRVYWCPKYSLVIPCNTCLMNLAWGILHNPTLNMTKIYVPMTRLQWNLIWLLSTGFHFLIGYIIQYQICSHL